MPDHCDSERLEMTLSLSDVHVITLIYCLLVWTQKAALLQNVL